MLQHAIHHLYTKIGVSILIALGIVFISQDWFTEITMAILVTVMLLYGVLVVFLHDVFWKDAPVSPEDSDAEALSFDIVLRLPDGANVDMPTLVTAAMHSPRGRFFLEECGLEQASIQAVLRDLQEDAKQSDVEEFLKLARASLSSLDRTRISPSVIFATLFNLPAENALLKAANISPEQAADIVRFGTLKQRLAEQRNPLSIGYLQRHFSGIGRSWVHGYTDALDMLTDDLEETLEHQPAPITRIHTQERDQALQLLQGGTHHNVLLTGEQGVGKNMLALSIARELRSQERVRHLPDTRVLVLRTEQLLSAVGSADRFLLAAIASAKRAGHFLLILPDLPLLFSAASPELLAVLIRLLQEPSIHIVAVCDGASMHSILEKNPGLIALFEQIPVQELSSNETKSVLMEEAFTLSHNTGVRITYRAVCSVLSLSDRYLGSLRQPKKSISILKEAVSLAAKTHETYVREEHIQSVVSGKAHMNVNAVTLSESQALLTLAERMKQRIIGQHDAIDAIANALKRGRLDIGARNRPVGTFLLLGSTGVGKTYTAKVLAEEYFGTNDAFIRIDLNEFATAESAGQLLSGPLVTHVQDHPSSLILLDEIEKAHQSVLHLFLQILDEGQLTNANGQRVDFRNTLIIATSNAGSAYIHALPKEKTIDRAAFTKDLLEQLIQTHVFTPEFINRFDAVIGFLPLTKDDAKEVLALLLNDVTAKVQKQHGVTVQLEPACMDLLLDRGYSKEFGAREMRRLVADTVETAIADAFLKKQWSRGEVLTLTALDFHF